jgi:hypothetical protein
VDKKIFSFDDIEAQSALELPDREMMLVTVVITNLLNNNTVEIDVRNVNVAAQVCAQVLAIGGFKCDVKQ